MGKGNGNKPPRYFIGFQHFCEASIFILIAASITFSSFSVGMDDGGTFSFQYYFTGFVLGPILLVNLLSRMYVVHAVEKRGVTREKIVEVLTKTFIGRIIWPWSCRVGIMWCIPGILLTALGGVNCVIIKHHNGTHTTIIVKNSCYYDIEGGHGEMYRGLAIGLVVVHIVSFIYLICSNCPVHTVLSFIKEDPRQEGYSALMPDTQPSDSTVTSTLAAISNLESNNRDLVTKIERLETRITEIENRDTSHAQAHGVGTITKPPPYSQSTEASTEKNFSV